ncbi:MAG: ATP-binding protein, partial [Anaerolineae bacterium]|nr:ATP-binding protein [Anaerolineae bacterium]
EDLLRQVLENLVRNAVQYTPIGGVITVSAHEMDYGAAQIHIEVRDTGIGILAGEQNHIFEPFFRAPDDETRQTPGNGLALHLSKLLIEMQDGYIGFESTRGQGSCFYIRLPVIHKQD